MSIYFVMKMRLFALKVKGFKFDWSKMFIFFFRKRFRKRFWFLKTFPKFTIFVILSINLGMRHVKRPI